MRLSQRVGRIAPSATLALNAQAKAMKAAGEDVVSLTAGEPDFDTPPHIVEAIREALARGETRYTAVPGVPELREAIARRYVDLGVDARAEQTVVTTGGKQAIFNAMLCLLEPGDEVILTAPYWLSYADIVRFCGAEPVVLPTRDEDGFRLNPEQLEEALSERTRMLVLNSPSNPTGAVYEDTAMKALLAPLRGRPEVFLMFDEIYDRLVYEARFASPLEVAPEFAERTVVVNGGSKAYAMTGIRIGWALGPEPLIKAMTKLQGQSTSNASAPSQYGLLAALTGDQAPVETMRLAFQTRRDAALTDIAGIEGLSCTRPEGAFYLFPRVSAFIGKKTPEGRPIAGATDLAAHLLATEKLVVVPGDPFGSDQHVRLSFAVAERSLKEGLNRLGRALDALN
ncbi:MAG: pyridoxal phosphate-dependent aminotransferase [Myxococcota bacterium]